MEREQRGFTLLELLVVIAIIGVLAVVVLASLNSARSKGADAAVMQELANMRPAAELIYSTTDSYDSVCDPDSDTGKLYRSAFLKAQGSGNVVCNDSDSGHYWGAAGTSLPLNSANSTGGVDGNGSYWGASLPLSDGTWFCVDYFGTAQVQPDRGVSHTSLSCS